jgi:acetylornithine deacetylase/succinyl-diaminopimelate desuccinylase family protein
MPQGLFENVQKAIDPEWIFRVLHEMILIRSENPFEDPPQEGYREKEMADYLAGHLSALGLKVETREVRPGRPNVFGFLNGKQGRTTLMLAGHMDTARTTGYPEAYAAKVEGGQMHGRGACDMKAALAAYLGVVKALRKSGSHLNGHLIICGIVDEEYQMLGSKAIGQGGRLADQGIIGEPTNLRVCPANKGRVSTKIVTRGRAAHSSVPEKGINAIDKMSKVIRAFGDYNQELLGRSPHPLCGHGRFTPGVIRGGVQVNMVPDYCELEVDRRTLPGETRESVYSEFTARIRKAAEGDPDFAYEITEPTWLIAPNDISPGEPVVAALRAAHQGIFGRDPGVEAFVAGSDAPYMGFPTVICGPGSIAQAHTTCEFVNLQEVTDAARLYLHAALQLLG